MSEVVQYRPKFAYFWPPIFLLENPLNLGTCIIKSFQIPIMWQSFTAADGARRSRGKLSEM